MSGAQQPGEGLLARLGIGGWVARDSVEFRGPAKAPSPSARTPSPSAKAPSPARGAAPAGKAQAEQGQAADGQEQAAAQVGEPDQIWFCRAHKGARALVVCLGGGGADEGRAMFLQALAAALDSVLPRDQEDGKDDKSGGGQQAGGPRDAILAQRPAANRSQAIPQITAAAEQVRGGAVLWLGPPLDELEDRCRDAGAAVLQGPPLDELMADPQKKRALWEQMRALKRD